MKEEISDENNKTCSSGEEDSVVTMDLFVGNLSLYTTEPKLHTYFSTFGNVSSVKICTHPENGKNKRFGFLNFDNMDVISKILNYPRHEIDGKILEIRYASKNILNKRKAGLVKVKPEGSQDGGEENGGTKELSTPAKIFVGGVSQNAKVEDLRVYFSSFGPVLNVTLLPDHITGRHRGFGFVTFENESTAEVVCASRYHTIKMKKVECKKASSSRNLKGQDKKSSSTTSEGLVSSQWLLDPNNKNPGLMGQHPWQNMSNNNSGGLFLNTSPYTLYPSPFSFTPIYIDPLMSFGSSSPHTPLGVSHHYKLLNHRFISDSSIRYSPYSLGNGGGSRVHSTGVGEVGYQAAPLLLPNIPVESGVEETNMKQQSEQLHHAAWGGGGSSFLPPARKI